MKAHTSEFKENVKLFGRELDSKITYELDGEEVELGSEELNSITPRYEGAILKSVMKQLDIDSNVEIPIGTILTYQFGLKVGNGYEYINFGNYVVKTVEKQEDTRSWKITCYDKMLYAMKDYENSDITFPITIRDYINAICEKVDLVFANESEQFANYDKVINNELYLDSDGRSLGYTFRDVLDELAEVTASTICINEDDELEIRYIKDVGELTNVSGADLTLETDSEVQLNNFELEGKTTQETRSGKNLLKNTASSQTTNGVTFTVNNDKTITANGTATAQIVLVISNSITLSGSYVLSGCPSGGSSSTYELQLYGVSGAVDYGSGKTISSGTGVARIVIRNGVTVNNIVFKPMISTSGGEYEPYGVMPSPDYPSELVSVGYRNLFDKNTENVLNAYINGSSVITSSSPDRSYWLPIKRNTNYTIKMTQIAISTSAYVDDFQAGLFTTTPAISVSGSRVFSKVRASATEDYTFTETFNSGNYDYLVIKVGNNTRTKIQESLETLQLEEGTQAHSYIPYGKYGIEIVNTGKNLFDGFIELGSLSNGSPVNANTRLRSINFSKVLPNTTYTVSWENDNANINSGVLVAYYSNNNYISATSGYKRPAHPQPP